jgi:hypothetical protein
MQIDGSLRVETDGDKVFVVVLTDGKEAALSLSLTGAENLAEYLVRAVRTAEALHSLSDAT